MTEIRLNLALPDPAPRDSPGGPVAPGPATYQFIGEDGRPLGDAEPLRADPPVLVEGPGEDGGLAWAPARPRASVSADAPEGARIVRVRAEGGVADIMLEDASDPPERGPDDRRMFPDGGGRWTLAVVAERFDDANDFFAHARSLFDFITGQVPFDDPALGFAIEALYWQSDRTAGLFGATDRNISGRVLAGDNGRVRRFVAAAGSQPRKILVIINSSKRAGAGGQGRETPSWSTVTPSPGEPWQAIALHELGHAFGLADEYDVAYDLAEPDPLEPNISAEADPSRTSWHARVTAAVPPRPTALRGHEDDFDIGTVGTFQGARYRPDDRYRPSPSCRMRVTTRPFCKVCAAHIRAELLE